MIKVVRTCDTCKKDYEQNIKNSATRTGNIVTFTIDFECSDCILKKARKNEEQTIDDHNDRIRDRMGWLRPMPGS